MTRKQTIEYLLKLHGYSIMDFKSYQTNGSNIRVYDIAAKDKDGDTITAHDEFDMVCIAIINQTKDIQASPLHLTTL